MSDAQERAVRWAIGLALLVGLVLAGFRVVHWATDDGPPVGDKRACKGTEVPLDRALSSVGLDLPAGAKDLHYLARTDPTTGQFTLQVAFRSSRTVMTDYLTHHGMTADQAAKLDDPRYIHADVPGTGLCGKTDKGPTIMLPVATGGAARWARAEVEVDGDTMLDNPVVVLSAPN